MCVSDNSGEKTLVFVHETKKENRESIFKHGLRMSSDVTHIDGQGCRNKILTSDFNYYSGMWFDSDVDQVNGVYFRVMPKLHFDKCFAVKDEFVYFTLDVEWLNDHLGLWYFNSTENHGFHMTDTSQFSGNPGSTFFSMKSMFLETNDENSDDN